MQCSLIICTYQRPQALYRLLESLQLQTRYPEEVIVVDASLNEETKRLLEHHTYANLRYFLVDKEHRGLTKQRNFGIQQVLDQSEIIAFLDDDIILYPNYFEQLLGTYQKFPEALGVGGYIINETHWKEVGYVYLPKENEFYWDGWVRKDGSRMVWRKKLGLDSNVPPGWMPTFGHGRSIGFLPPSGKTYQVEQLMGGVSSFKKEVFQHVQFSTFFEGYGLYEDADFTLRLSKLGKLYLNTAAQLEHHHEPSGRPNQYQYGQMVVRNGWYVWRVKHPKPTISDRFKWHSITLGLLTIRFLNTFTTPSKKQAWSESLGRVWAYFRLFWKKPQ
ncbi:MAG: glycosyltransferase family 2 protein [Flavobacteriales bacterium]|nr:glycosyltransferase family 2 protein [Flavobacteriales bacterium]